MLRILVEAARMWPLVLAAATGPSGIQTCPVSPEDVFLWLIAKRAPYVYRVLAYGYATLWFRTPYFATSLLMSFVTIVTYRRTASVRVRPLPPRRYPEVRES